ncbi:hypothetical protein FB567DRAFT_598649 [Paraphoma chrysanthemicola]|uniref:Uncharacterized protein n=1 Tax=Paraphoma chrysanthemicola TaxID=798071 RepID=A0A8K0VSV2_9PLEO|nr:hypothetical protein FB567DRAFT_598649 [Paraphoma chrysanthemicola]
MGLQRNLARLAERECRSLCMQIQARFPRELRDMIWTDLTSSEAPNHCWNVKYMGDEATTEILHTWYRTMVLYLSYGFEDFRVMPPLRAFSSEQISKIKPNIEYTINSEKYCKSNPDDELRHEFERSVVAEELEMIGVFNAGTKVTIILNVWHVYYLGSRAPMHNEDVIRRFLRVVEPVLFQHLASMQRAGYILTIKLACRGIELMLPEDVELSEKVWVVFMKQHQALSRHVIRIR